MRQVTKHCDRCGQNILEGGNTVQHAAGSLTKLLPEDADYCDDCSASYVSWYRSGRAGQAIASGASKDKTGRLPVPSPERV